MNPFDELTLAEVDDLVENCLDGETDFEKANPIKLSGAVMFMHAKRSDPTLSWKTFMETTRMADIKKFSEQMNPEVLDPTNGSMPSNV